MRAISQNSMPTSASAAETFRAALGVVQNAKNLDILAVHNDAHKLVAYERSKMSNQKIYVVAVDDQGTQATLHLAVGTDPRTRKALLDGKANQKSANRFFEAVQGTLDGTTPSPVTPVANHYVQKKTQLPWADPSQEPEIDLGSLWFGIVGHEK